MYYALDINMISNKQILLLLLYKIDNANKELIIQDKPNCPV